MERIYIRPAITLEQWRAMSHQERLDATEPLAHAMWELLAAEAARQRAERAGRKPPPRRAPRAHSTVAGLWNELYTTWLSVQAEHPDDPIAHWTEAMEGWKQSGAITDADVKALARYQGSSGWQIPLGTSGTVEP